jgi:ElaB/YqjD/DUF883 family membrane-anchored ribosome-binding protein
MDNSTLTHGISDSHRLDALSADQTAARMQGQSSDVARDKLNRARGLAHEAIDRVATSAAGLVDRVEGGRQTLVDLPQRAWDYSRGTVQSHPAATIALAVLAGFAVARLIDWRR